MMARKRARACASSRAVPCSVSMKPDSAASGVRSSWLALATKSARISSTRCSGVRSWNTSRIEAAGGASPSGRTCAMNQRSTGTRWANSTLRAPPPAATVAHRLDHLGDAQRERGRRAARERRRDDARQRVERHDPRVAIEYDRRRPAGSSITASSSCALADAPSVARAAPRRVARSRAGGQASSARRPMTRHDSPWRGCMFLSANRSPLRRNMSRRRYFPGASPSHNSRTPRIMSDSANGIT